MSLLKILALVIALSTSHSALAKVYALGDISPSSSNSSLSFETDVIYGDTNFLDYFTFRLTSNAATVFGSAPDVTVSVGNGTDSTNIISADLFLEKSAMNDLINSDESFAFENISAGTYFFAVSGKHRGTLGGSYTFNLASSESLTTPIPEPASFALLGLGLLGLLARSKLSDSKG